MLKKLQNKPTHELEDQLLSQDYHRIIGIDEAGRGSWAGPVAIGAYIYDKSTQCHPAVNDSKKLTPKSRTKILEEFSIPSYQVILKSSDTIDTRGIGTAISIAIQDIIAKYDDGHTFFLIDGYFKDNFGIRAAQVIKGDSKHYCIAAASIAAKVIRDEYMTKLHLIYPQYGFSKHKGYGTKLHFEQLLKYGVTPEHRSSFSPVKDII